ncbi:Polysaccharide deacetylase [Geodermatophilus saharensis]|uniref:Polysaccharide deacetylase n=1 Tax=Geodermatophilus saharensis TaxID=1137994 RepID=A0A239I943_9ACTN|nr:polysaccharide deacetylase family protein [Geodermatophilus saharensis]SNS90140.1 Polysaccharide deacetylase [Geodermatophilus saharensis]
MSVILMYHRVADIPHDPFELAVHPDRFAAHVEHLSSLRRTVPVEDVTARHSAGGIAVTFDDGYADNATVAAPMLAAAQLPATWFITAGRLGQRRFWWDRLIEALLGPHPLRDSVDVRISGRDHWLDLRGADARRTAMRFLHTRLRPLPPEELEATVDELVDRMGAPAPAQDDLTMTVEQLRELAALPLQEIGAHTRTHVQLGGQPEHLQRAEILGSVEDLSTLLHRPVRTFAYPFGVPDAVGSRAPRLVEEAGCVLACTTSPGVVGRRSRPHLLPRLHVRDWEGDEFAARISQTLSRR